MEELTQELSTGLSLQTTTPTLQAALDDSAFSIFTSTLDLGYFSWKPVGSYKKLFNVQSNDIRQGVDFHGAPSQVLSVAELRSKCPLKFSKRKSKSRKNEYPYDPSYLVPLYVAVTDRNVDLEQVDFLFGGSTLHMLATQSIRSDCEYYAQLVPGTNILLIQKYTSYKQNLSDPGFQFERFVCGQQGNGDFNTCHHLQVLTISNRYKILVSAECDGMDSDNNPVEIKCKANTEKVEIKTVFQMISSGSLSLYLGNKTKLPSVTRVHSRSLGSVINSAFHNTDQVTRMERNLLSALNTLQEAVHAGAFAHERVMILSFVEGKIKLNPFQLIPPESVVKDLIQSRVSRKKHSQGGNERRLKPVDDNPDWERLRMLPDEMVVGVGYVPENFCGFDSD